jgi:hypothetical protein
MGNFDYKDICDSLPKSSEPETGPIFITANGKFINISPDGEHGDVFGDSEYDSEDYYALEDNFGLIKANGGNSSEPVPYIDLWRAPNRLQRNAIIDWLYFLLEHGRKTLQVNSGTECFEVDLSEDIPEDTYEGIIRRLGSLRETVGDDAGDSASMSDSPSERMLYHGSSKEITTFDKPINWVTSDKEYAREFALFAAETGYLYHVDTRISNVFDCGGTDGPCYGLLPIQPYSFSPGLETIYDALDINEDVMRDTLSTAADEYAEPMGGYRMRLHTLIRSEAFAELLKSLGYRCVRCVEGGHEAYGMLYHEDMEITDKETVSAK